MATDLLHDRGRGPEIIGTRMTVYNLLPYFLDPTATEAYICRMCELTPEQVAAARAYVLNNPDTVLAEHLKIESRMEAGNPLEVIERAKQAHVAFRNFRDWLAERERVADEEHAADSTGANGQPDSGRFPTFREWLSQRESRPEEGS
ncbi:MAG TPA: hypothetical protein VN688_03390 [Gemmataceae bacterium]|nr:hypothetical protein [Gemmataceae bacterium]